MVGIFFQKLTLHLVEDADFHVHDNDRIIAIQKAMTEWCESLQLAVVFIAKTVSLIMNENDTWESTYVANVCLIFRDKVNDTDFLFSELCFD